MTKETRKGISPRGSTAEEKNGLWSEFMNKIFYPANIQKKFTMLKRIEQSIYVQHCLRCDTCGEWIQKLSEEEADGDIFPHAWADYKTANAKSCNHCWDKYGRNHFPYETYVAGRVGIKDEKVVVFESDDSYIEWSNQND